MHNFTNSQLKQRTTSLQYKNSPIKEHKITVLLIDDQPIIGEGVRRMLVDEEDIDFHFCSDATEAMTFANEVEPTVILQDLIMPEIYGLHMVKFFRANLLTKDIPIIMLSTKEEPTTKAEAFANGANDYIVKLPDKIELIARIRYHSKGYINLLERNEAFAALRQEQEKAESLLLNILPEPIADRLKDGQNIIGDYFPEVSVMFADIVGFTKLSTILSPTELVAELNDIFSAFDLLTEKHGVEKIKTIGDAYMVASGLPHPRGDHAKALVELGIDILSTMEDYNTNNKHPISIRIGISSGPVVAGVMGSIKFIYDLWGDTVNIASRMESHGIEGHIQISEATRNLLTDNYKFEDRGAIQVKGKGEMSTHLITN